jgi:hypothetical protein
MTGTAANRRKRSAASPPTPAGSQGVWERGGIKEHGARGTSVIGLYRHHHAGKAAGQSREYPADLPIRIMIKALWASR